MAGFIRRLHGKYPLITNCVTYGAIYVGSEFGQQIVYNRLLIPEGTEPKPINTEALCRYAVVGTFLYPSTLYYWYKWLDRRFSGTSMNIIVPKLLLDQFVITPVLLIGFFVSMSVMEGKDDIFEECKKKVIPTFQKSCAFWLPAQLMNFLLIPPAARVVYVAVCGAIWINILCWTKRQ